MIVIVARQNLSLTQKCYASCLAQETVDPPILIINNACDDGTANWLRTEAPRQPHLRCLSFEEQHSVAASWNAGLDYAWRCGFEQALVLNQDTEIRPDTYRTLWSELIDGVGLATGVSVRTRQELDDPYGRQISNHPDFSCFMIAKWAHKRVRFDEAYEGAFVEDCQFHIEAHRGGIRCINTNLRFLHHGSATIKNSDEAEQKRIGDQAERNRRLFYSRYGAWPGSAAYERLFT